MAWVVVSVARALAEAALPQKLRVSSANPKPAEGVWKAFGRCWVSLSSKLGTMLLLGTLSRRAALGERVFFRNWESWFLGGERIDVSLEKF